MGVIDGSHYLASVYSSALLEGALVSTNARASLGPVALDSAVWPPMPLVTGEVAGVIADRPKTPEPTKPCPECARGTTDPLEGGSYSYVGTLDDAMAELYYAEYGGKKGESREKQFSGKYRDELKGTHITQVFRPSDVRKTGKERTAAKEEAKELAAKAAKAKAESDEAKLICELANPKCPKCEGYQDPKFVSVTIDVQSNGGGQYSVTVQYDYLVIVKCVE